MRTPRTRLLVVSTALIFALTGCAADPATKEPKEPSPNTSTTEQPRENQDSEPQSTPATSDTVIPPGAYAASDAFPFPIPEGWEILDPFTEGTLGKDVSIDGSVEYPGDAKEAAATYLDLLKTAGFDAYTYAPGEITNQASLAAEGNINGTAYTAILNFDVHADGSKRVSITIVEQD
ncbi:MAG: hypothetical protein Q4G35_01550 [Propionibacteriaceae bacterium]|nr:hypothetical protein [Propionibacteriaceae bacterium]